MCLGIPMKVIEIAEKMGVAELGGVRRKVALDLLDDVKCGDYVIIHAGYAIQTLSEKEAFETLGLLDELFRTEVSQELNRDG